MAPRILAAVAALGLGLAAPAAADTETTDLVIASDRVGDRACQNNRLAFSVGSYTGACSDATFGGLLASSKDVLFPVADGLPLTLDAARPIHLELTSVFYLGDSPRGPIGDETMTVTLTGKRFGSTTTTTIGTASTTVPAAERFGTNERIYTFDVQPTADKAGKYKSLTLAVRTGGAYFGGYTTTDGTSFVTFPIIDGSGPVATE